MFVKRVIARSGPRPKEKLESIRDSVQFQFMLLLSYCLKFAMYTTYYVISIHSSNAVYLTLW